MDKELEIDFLNYVQSLDLHKLGFNESCFGWWFAPEEMLVIEKIKASPSNSVILAPTYYQAFRWFRKNYPLLFFDLQRASYLPQWSYQIVVDGGLYPYDYPFEEAQSALLDKLIQQVKANDKDKWKLN